jgi:hypothetical protein
LQYWPGFDSGILLQATADDRLLIRMMLSYGLQRMYIYIYKKTCFVLLSSTAPREQFLQPSACRLLLPIHRWTRLLKQQTSITACRLPTKETKLPFSMFSVYTCLVHIRIHIYIYIYIYVHIRIHTYTNIYTYMYIYAPVSNGKRKPRRLSLIRLPFAHRANGSFVVCPFADDETNGS